MKLYEVKFDLTSGRTLSMLVAAPDAQEARGLGHHILTEASEPRNEGDCIKYNWHFADIEVSEVSITAEPADDFNADGPCGPAPDPEQHPYA